MKIAWLAPYPAETLAPALRLARVRGVEHPCSWVVNLAAALAARPDVELHLVTLAPQVEESQTITRDNIVFHVLRSGVPGLHRGWPWFLPVDVLTGFAGDARRLVRELRRIQPDLVHAHGTEAAYARAAADSGYPCLISIQGVVSELAKIHPQLRFRVAKRLEQVVVRRCRFFGCRTEFDSGFVRRLNPHAHIFTLHEAIGHAFFRNQWEVAESATILYVGALCPWKGLDYLLQAMAIAVRRRPMLRLRVVGGGGAGAQKHYRALAASLGVQNHVEFLGFLPAERIAAEHLTAQVFVLPSQNENSPNALAEAMVSGMPVIATRVGGIPSMAQDGETGLLVPWADAPALADKIIWLLDHPEQRRRLGENARRVARQRHDPQRVAEQTVAAYKEILASVESAR